MQVVRIGLVDPCFDYCSVWGSCDVGLSEKLQKLQNLAAHILLYACIKDDIDKLFWTLGAGENLVIKG